MKLREGFIRHEVAGEHMAVAAGEAGRFFHGLIRNNPTADYIFELLMQPTTEQAIVEKLCERYDVDAERAAKDVHALLAQLRAAGILEE